VNFQVSKNLIGWIKGLFWHAWMHMLHRFKQRHGQGGGAMSRRMRRVTVLLSAIVLALAGAGAVAYARTAAAAQSQTSFDMVRSAAAVNAGCLAGAQGHVTIRSRGPVEVMKVKVEGLPAKTEFDLFVIQVPNTPFGVSWYQGDIETNGDGRGSGTFIGRFSIETFAVAPGVAPAPVVHHDPPFPDASQNPAFAPVHTFHLGLWFNAPADAAAAGCPATVTPFNGDHTAGIQALSTRNFPDNAGPLQQIRP
jgi:hypothetical protein